uniref:Extensin-like n=1 Tax=Angiostrongylus cantonensis TaxID=6313 RepID=A0A0K0DNL2_ANGCA
MVCKFFFGSFIFKNFRTKRGTYERPISIVKQYDASQQLRSPPGSIGPQVPIKPSHTGYVPVKQPPSPPFVLPTLPPLPPPPPPPPPYILPTLPPPRPLPPSPPTYGVAQGPSSYGRPPNVKPPPYYGPRKGYSREPNVGPSLLYGSKLSYGRPQPSYPTFIEGPFPQGPLSPQPFSPENFGEHFDPTGPFDGKNPQYPLLGQQLPNGFPGSQALARASSKINEYPSVRKSA